MLSSSVRLQAREVQKSNDVFEEQERSELEEGKGEREDTRTTRVAWNCHLRYRVVKVEKVRREMVVRRRLRSDRAEAVVGLVVALVLPEGSLAVELMHSRQVGSENRREKVGCRTPRRRAREAELDRVIFRHRRRHLARAAVGRFEDWVELELAAVEVAC